MQFPDFFLQINTTNQSCVATFFLLCRIIVTIDVMSCHLLDIAGNSEQLLLIASKLLVIVRQNDSIFFLSSFFFSFVASSD